MVVVEGIEQGSEAWHELRLGVVTASNANRIVTATGRLSSQRVAYMADLLTEIITGEPTDILDENNEWIERGKILEAEARRWYEFHTSSTVKEVSFIYKNDAKQVGCSPDGMTDDGCLELKSPAPHTHMLYWLDAQNGLKKYMPQVQMQLWVTGLPFADFVSYCPGLPNVAVRVEPSEAHFDAFDKHIPTFVDELHEARAKLAEQGYVAL